MIISTYLMKKLKHSEFKFLSAFIQLLGDRADSTPGIWSSGSMCFSLIRLSFSDAKLFHHLIFSQKIRGESCTGNWLYKDRSDLLLISPHYALQLHFTFSLINSLNNPLLPQNTHIQPMGPQDLRIIAHIYSTVSLFISLPTLSLYSGHILLKRTKVQKKIFTKSQIQLSSVNLYQLSGYLSGLAFGIACLFLVSIVHVLQTLSAVY